MYMYTYIYIYIHMYTYIRTFSLSDSIRITDRTVDPQMVFEAPTMRHVRTTDTFDRLFLEVVPVFRLHPDLLGLFGSHHSC